MGRAVQFTAPVAQVIAKIPTGQRLGAIDGPFVLILRAPLFQNGRAGVGINRCQLFFGVVDLLLELRQLFAVIAGRHVSLAVLHAVEGGDEAVVLLGADRIELMIMATGAVDR